MLKENSSDYYIELITNPKMPRFPNFHNPAAFPTFGSCPLAAPDIAQDLARCEPSPENHFTYSRHCPLISEMPDIV
jgi:hypothetical protein